jgi:predicted  nucleic acid-binding Zn-ribbon protein
MSDYSELKKRAEAVVGMDYPWEHTIRDGRLGKTSTAYALMAHPVNVLALIAENERLKSDLNESNDLVEHLGDRRKALTAERDQLKTENEALVDALNEILRVTPMGVEAFGIAALVLGEMGVSKESSK